MAASLEARSGIFSEGVISCRVMPPKRKREQGKVDLPVNFEGVDLELILGACVILADISQIKRVFLQPVDIEALSHYFEMKPERADFLEGLSVIQRNEKLHIEIAEKDTKNAAQG